MKILLIIFFLTGLFITRSFSQIQDRFLNPNHENLEKRQVTIGILLVDVKKIDDAEQSVIIDFAIRLMWKDDAFSCCRLF